MLALMAAPLIVTFYLSVRNCVPDMEVVKIQQSGPFGTTEGITQRVKLDAGGKPITLCRFVGFDYFRSVLGIGSVASVNAADGAPPDDASAGGSSDAVSKHRSTEFTGALQFTLLYTLVTMPFVLLLGFLVALGVHHCSPRYRSIFITASLIPFIITPLQQKHHIASLLL